VASQMINYLMQGRFDEFKLKLASIAKHFERTVRRYNSAVIVAYPDAAPDRRSSIGVHRLLCNYYKPNADEQQKLAAAPDAGKERSAQAFRHSIDKPTFREKFAHLIPAMTYESYDETLAAANMLSEHCKMIPLGPAEFILGSRQIMVREFPYDGASWVHLTGAIDATFYNLSTHKLVLVELKSSFPQNNARFFSMETLFLKEQHAKQLTLYARLLLLMAQEARVPLSSDDLELCILANNKSRHQISAWRMAYDPVTFLGSAWSPHWHPIELQLPLSCAFCGRFDELQQTRSTPVIVVCRPCFTERRCACGQLGRFKSQRTGAYVCNRRCKLRVPRLMQ
jgi:hypothetical protein